jgi:tryptophanyl-tRNA synthetase
MTRDIASSFNHRYGETFVVPEALIDENVMLVPGTDGRKMSKSYDNYINIFLPDKALRKQVMKIETDSTPLEEPKNPDSCNVFALYQLLGNDAEVELMRKNYLGGNYGYGHAKQALFELIVKKYSLQREKYWELIENKEQIDQLLSIGAEKAKAIARPVLKRVREKLGFNI